MKIGLRGITLLSASGDDGAFGPTDQQCTQTTFSPTFPSSSPFVTTVGATQIYDAVDDLVNPPPVCSSSLFWWCASGGTEQAVSYGFTEFASGGGFSNISLQPSWQKIPVIAFLNSTTGKQTPVSYFNPKGRAYPDLSALGAQVLIWNNNQDQSVYGTSASTSIVAGIISLLNDYSIKKTGKTLGPLNQLIYKMAANHPQSFTDIITGDNTCSASGCFNCEGFYAGPGWDPVTGLGTPVYTEMLAYLKTIL